jgi:ribonuclease HI
MPTTPSLFSETSAPKPQSKDWISAHCDGGARGNPGPAGFGALIQDANGNVLAELSEFLGIRTNNFAEYSGLLASLQYALDHHHPRLRVVSDSELMVKQIQGKYKVNSPDLRPLWQEAKNRIAKLEAFEISHALRYKNKDADRLANEAMDRGTKRSSTTPAASPLKATNSPAKSTLPTIKNADPYAKADTMLRGFTKDGVVHILGNATLPDGVFVKIIRE